MTNLQAAVGLAQLERLDEFVSIKRRMGKRYTELLSDTPGIQLPPAQTDYANNIYWVYGVVLEDNIIFDAKQAITKLSKLGIGARPFFWPMHEQPALRNRGLFAGESYPSAERIARRGFYIPSGMALTDHQIEQSATALKEILQ